MTLISLFKLSIIIKPNFIADEKSKQSHETVKPSAVATTDNQTVEDEAPWRRNSLARARTQNESPTKIRELYLITVMRNINDAFFCFYVF